MHGTRAWCAMGDAGRCLGRAFLKLCVARLCRCQASLRGLGPGVCRATPPVLGHAFFNLSGAWATNPGVQAGQRGEPIA